MYKCIILSFFFLNVAAGVEVIQKEKGSVVIKSIKEKIEQGENLSDKYRAGPYLIYDCTAEHFVCADVENQVECDVSREKSFVKKSERLPCAVLKQYSSRDVCLEEQSKFMLNKKYDFCFARRSERFYRYQDTR